MGSSLRNKTLILTEAEAEEYARRLLRLSGPTAFGDIENRTINQDLFEIVDWLPDGFVDLLFVDPPYNLTKSFRGETFAERSMEQYGDWLESWLPRILRTLKPSASIYICGDWRSSPAIHQVASKYLNIRNRITWEREKGRGAKANWKNASEDIFFCTAGENYTFNLDAVKVARRVIAPYTDGQGEPKDWVRTAEGGERLTHPSNLWTDLTVPFWSMPENTEHPTQKPEKLLAKIILASSNPGDVVFDPFLGSGTTSVTASKLGRRFAGVEADKHFCCLAEKRLALAAKDRRIQGYEDGVFRERNSALRQTPGMR
jgi:site-specific DNA-methyltransferase (adenine-specific)